tara:strand:+ start:5295 stop:5678 length:384 start_codon:yes stop_codon:yes gene_type:complete
MNNAKSDYISAQDRAQSPENAPQGIRDGMRWSRWGPQVRLDKTGSFEIWETIPKSNGYGGIRRELGETFLIDEVTYMVIEITPGAAVAKETLAKIVKYIDENGEERERKVRGKGTIRVSLYRQASDD